MSSFNTPADIAAPETASLIAASKVNGTSVYNQQGESLGVIHDVMLDKCSGAVTYAVMSFGGFLGIGAQYHPLPWHLLTYSEELGGYVVDLDRRVLQGAPAYSAAEAPDWTAKSYTNDIDSYYAGQPAVR